MALTTTCIGAFPKPSYVPVTDWFQVGHKDEAYSQRAQRGWENSQKADVERLLDRATAEVVADQISCGVDVPTDGEVRRENYIHYQCRHFEGFDFQGLTRRVLRNGAYTSDLPTIRDKVVARGVSKLVRDWQVAEAAAGRPVKITLPGPMTISDTTADAYYHDEEALAEDLASALNVEVRALADAGCRYIQIDEPIFARKPEQALAFGTRTLAKCFEGVSGDVTRVVHMCCGYPDKLDATDYPKADPKSYELIAQAVDGVVDQISIEDAHRHNPLKIFELFESSSLIVGLVTIASSRIESVNEISSRIETILTVLPSERLIVAPDCGLGFLGRDLSLLKLTNMCAAAGRF